MERREDSQDLGELADVLIVFPETKTFFDAAVPIADITSILEAGGLDRYNKEFDIFTEEIEGKPPKGLYGRYFEVWMGITGNEDLLEDKEN